MSVRLRLQRLEDARKAKVAYQETPESREKTRQWLHDTIKSINDGTPSPPSPHFDLSGYSPKQLAVIASPKVWLEEKIREQKEMEATR